MTEAGNPPRVLFAQFANPGAYPPVLNAAAIVSAELGALVRFVGVTRTEDEGMTIPDDLGSGHRLIDLPAPGWRQKTAYLRWLATTIVIGVSWRADLLYVSDFYAAPAGVALHLGGIHVVYHEHDLPQAEPGNSSWIRLLLRARRRMGRFALACAAPGDERARRLSNDIGSLRTYSVPNYPRVVEIPRNDPDARRASPILHYHGSVGEARLPLSVLEALTVLPEEVVLQIIGYETIGTTGYLDRVRRQAVEMGVGHRVRIRPAMPRRQLLEECRSAAVGLMLLTTASADLNMQTMASASNKIFDYLGCGLPVVVSDAPGLAELVRGAGIGAACEDLSPEGIAAAVSPLLDDRDEAEAIGRRGRKLIEASWNYDLAFRPVLDAIRGALRPRDG